MTACPPHAIASSLLPSPAQRLCWCGSIVQPLKENPPSRLPPQLPHTCRHAAWLGGSVLAKVVGHQGLLVNKGEYDEWGPGAVHRKCY